MADSSTPSDPNIIPPDQSATSDPNRPISTILADSQPEAQTPLADSGSDYTEPTPTVPVDLPGEASLSTEASTKVEADSGSVQTPLADSGQSAPSVPADSTTQSADQSATAPPVAEAPPSSPSENPAEEAAPTQEPAAPITPEAASGSSIQDSLPSDQPSQVEPETPVSAPSASSSVTDTGPSQSAGIKPEPPQGTQNAPLADSDSQKSSFGDLGATTEPSSPVSPAGPTQPAASSPSPITPVPSPMPPAPSTSAPKTTFGDLGAKPPAEEATINIDPIEPPKPVQPPLPAEASAKAGQSPISPSSPQAVVEAKADFSSKRQQALQVRRKKRDDHLAKILALISQKGKIHNNDIVSVLRVSQSTATNYLHDLVKAGKIKKEGKGKASIYSL